MPSTDKATFDGHLTSCALCCTCGQRVCRLGYRHGYHRDCYDRLLVKHTQTARRLHPECPVCRGGEAIVATWFIPDEDQTQRGIEDLLAAMATIENLQRELSDTSLSLDYEELANKRLRGSLQAVRDDLADAEYYLDETKEEHRLALNRRPPAGQFSLHIRHVAAARAALCADSQKCSKLSEDTTLPVLVNTALGGHRRAAKAARKREAKLQSALAASQVALRGALDKEAAKTLECQLLTDQLAERESMVNILKTQVVDRDALVSDLQATCASHEERAVELTTAAAAAEEALHTLEDFMMVRETEAANEKATQDAIATSLMAQMDESCRVASEAQGRCATLEKQAEKYEKKLERAKDNQRSLWNQKEAALNAKSLCSICIDAEVNTALLPCGHLCACSECAKSLKKCPICRVKVAKKQPIFQSAVAE